MTNKPTASSPFRAILFLIACATYTNAAIVEFGACFQQTTNSHRCAISRSFCKADLDEVWFKPFQLKSSDGRKLCTCDDTHIGNCSPNHGYRGNCALEELSCPADNEYFRSSIYFYNDGASCMCHGMVAHPYSNNVIEMEKTMYGACETNGVYRCAIYSNSCESDELWLSPIELEQIGKPGCTCDKVLVGSCYNPLSSEPQCVVDSDSCDNASDFLSAFATKEMDQECLLCSSGVFGEKEKSNDDGGGNDDDAKEKVLNDPAYKTVPQQITQPTNGISKKSFGVVLGFMCTGLTTSLILAVFIGIKKKGSKGGVQAEKSGSVL
mmetsp:Transcript_11158/g.13219  ORF Transcript_11158/g.13219 Transcript_11158/m.13219 type:complete len:323 (-) Transcript_11158:137-1105(-)|eukprot:CAMPEP_0198269348 /NCGR_PEP_ID=MMETSP1447-20131203/41008_1 /TAXON_ID=420782 /ORGANISM="Chaetoceros dichaeta, Strain CCMP1751" /LENGTH=322 /DNA_ID=CAMNT_0043960909 /DNA_START=20 /DNA_END=988 /DNA_ORIENTATION=+